MGEHHVVVDGSRVESQAVVVATDAVDAARLTDGEVGDPGTNAVTTWWFAADEAPVQRPVIVLNGNDSGAVNNLAVLSQVSPGYSPDERSLVAVSTPAVGVDEGAVRSNLTEWYGSVVESWQTLRVDAIERAQPPPERRRGPRPVGPPPLRHVRGRRPPTARLDQRRADVRAPGRPMRSPLGSVATADTRPAARRSRPIASARPRVCAGQRRVGRTCQLPLDVGVVTRL